VKIDLEKKNTNSLYSSQLLLFTVGMLNTMKNSSLLTYSYYSTDGKCSRYHPDFADFVVKSILGNKNQLLTIKIASGTD
jgi:hypothetical protein